MMKTTFALVFFLSTITAGYAEPIDTVTISIAAEKTAYQTGEPVKLTVTISNPTDKEQIVFWNKGSEEVRPKIEETGSFILDVPADDAEPQYIKPGASLQKELSFRIENYTGQAKATLQYLFRGDLGFITTPHQMLCLGPITSNTLTVQLFNDAGIESVRGRLLSHGSRFVPAVVVEKDVAVLQALEKGEKGLEDWIKSVQGRTPGAVDMVTRYIFPKARLRMTVVERNSGEKEYQFQPVNADTADLMSEMHLPASADASKAMKIAEEFMADQPAGDCGTRASQTKDSADRVEVYFKRKGGGKPPECRVDVSTKTWEARHIPLR